jgi:hypothetical protein
VFLLMIVNRDWPKAVYALGVLLSVLAAFRYIKEPQGGLESKPS